MMFSFKKWRESRRIRKAEGFWAEAAECRWKATTVGPEHAAILRKLADCLDAQAAWLWGIKKDRAND